MKITMFCDYKYFLKTQSIPTSMKKNVKNVNYCKQVPNSLVTPRSEKILNKQSWVESINNFETPSNPLFCRRFLFWSSLACYRLLLILIITIIECFPSSEITNHNYDVLLTCRQVSSLWDVLL